MQMEAMRFLDLVNWAQSTKFHPIIIYREEGQILIAHSCLLVVRISFWPVNLYPYMLVSMCLGKHE